MIPRYAKLVPDLSCVGYWPIKYVDIKKRKFFKSVKYFSDLIRHLNTHCLGQTWLQWYGSLPHFPGILAQQSKQSVKKVVML